MPESNALPPSADSAARSSIEMWRLSVGAIPGAWLDERDGAAAVVTGIGGWGRNGVWTTRPDVAADLVDELLDRVAAADVPHSLQLREGAPAALDEVARRHGMVLDAHEPVMILENLASLRLFTDVTGLTVRRLDAHEGPVHARIAAPAFDERVEVFEAAANPAVLSVPGIRCYAGETEGDVVATAMTVTHGGVCAVFGVATSPEHRNRGFGGAVTAGALLDAFRTGAQWAWLQATPEATALYERLGFRVAETGAIWVRE